MKFDTLDVAKRLPQSRALFWHELQGRPQPEYLIKGVIDKGSLDEIYGPFGSGKSFVATDLGLHVALGWDWRGCRVRQAGVLYLSAEGGAAIVRRLEAWQRYHGETLDDVAFAVVTEPTNLLDPGGVEQVITDAAKVPDLGLIVIDTAARAMQGSDEGAEDMGRFVAACDRIRAETGAAVLVVHHSGKDPKKGSRGSTVLPAAVDAAIEVDSTGPTVSATATVVKCRDGETGKAFPFRLEVVELGLDEDGDVFTSCVPIEIDARLPVERSLSANQVTALGILQDAGQGGLTSDDWNDKLREIGIGTRRRATLHDLRMSLKRRKLVYEYDGRWYVTDGA